MRGGTYQQLHTLLRHELGLRRLAAIYVTALYDPADIQRALLVAGGVYHQIPFDLDALYEQIRALLAQTEGWLLPPSNADWRP
jgi:DNA-binding response OmpR family regulator